MGCCPRTYALVNGCPPFFYPHWTSNLLYHIVNQTAARSNYPKFSCKIDTIGHPPADGTYYLNHLTIFYSTALTNTDASPTRDVYAISRHFDGTEAYGTSTSKSLVERCSLCIRLTLRWWLCQTRNYDRNYNAFITLRSLWFPTLNRFAARLGRQRSTVVKLDSLLQEDHRRGRPSTSSAGYGGHGAVTPIAFYAKGQHTQRRADTCMFF